jgi:hypothetical protein
MRPERASKHSHTSYAEVKKERSYTSSPPMCHVGTIRDTFHYDRQYFLVDDTLFFAEIIPTFYLADTKPITKTWLYANEA